MVGGIYRHDWRASLGQARREGREQEGLRACGSYARSIASATTLHRPPEAVHSRTVARAHAQAPPGGSLAQRSNRSVEAGRLGKPGRGLG
jgi:hypothetical protein